MYSRFKSLHPTIDNITDEQVPIPIESAFFLEDGKPDKDKFNRYYFDFPMNGVQLIVVKLLLV